ncbi:MAG: hypothetical protein NT157_06140, partial [Candidatus Micrarchaeota archaeon]|nr:hypothetical protein [Candidatus Micrarchaeota archaeon]
MRKAALTVLALSFLILAGLVFAEYMNEEYAGDKAGAADGGENGTDSDYTSAYIGEEKGAGTIGLSEIEGTWEGEWSCPAGEGSANGRWSMTVSEGKAYGELESVDGNGTASGYIEGNRLIATVVIPCPITGEPLEYEWSGDISRKAGEYAVEGLGGAGGGCAWGGEKRGGSQYGWFGKATSGAWMNLTYVPSCIENCTKIVFLQVVCPEVFFDDGTSRYYEHQSDSSARWRFQDADSV